MVSLCDEGNRKWSAIKEVVRDWKRLQVANASLETGLSPSINICPVSYTHLDVYKRQGLFWSQANRRELVLSLIHI